MNFLFKDTFHAVKATERGVTAFAGEDKLYYRRWDEIEEIRYCCDSPVQIYIEIVTMPNSAFHIPVQWDGAIELYKFVMDKMGGRQPNADVDEADVTYPVKTVIWCEKW